MKTNINSLMALISIVFCLSTAGCIAFPKNYKLDAGPVSPELGSTPAKYYQVIDTLQPELKWKDIRSEGQTYDLCVWETQSRMQDESILGMPFVPRNWGESVYYIEGITENHHRVGKVLKPNTCYHWSIRTRTGGKVSEWSSFSQGMISLIIMSYQTNVPYGFITPQK